MNSTVLVIDAGNSSTSLGLYSGGRVAGMTRLDTARTTRASARRIVRAVCGSRAIRGGAIASVVPSVNAIWMDAVKAVTGHRALLVTHRSELGLRVTYPRPATIGADRLANAAGGIVRYGAPLIVADFGTAVTFDIVEKGAGYVGGVIAPGLPLMLQYMAEKTAKLPLIEPGPVRHAVGKSTEEAMRMGAQWGYRGLVLEIIKHLMKNRSLARARLVATGGHAKWIVKDMGIVIVLDRNLTLFGVGRIYELNA
jgi:type III pantothenate kinase